MRERRKNENVFFLFFFLFFAPALSRPVLVEFNSRLVFSGLLLLVFFSFYIPPSDPGEKKTQVGLKRPQINS